MVERNTIIEHQRQFLIEFSNSGNSLTHMAAKLALKTERFDEFAKMVWDQMENNRFPLFTKKQNAEFIRSFEVKIQPLQ
jgi:hypothetical protein